MPKLKLQRVFAHAIYNSLKNTPPKDYPTTGEIKETISGILPAFKDHVGTYIELQGEAETLSLQVINKELTEEEGKKAVEAINDKWKAYNKGAGLEYVEVKFSEEAFKILRTQFDRENWGTKWTANLDEYAGMLEAFDNANKKEAKKKKDDEDEE